MQKVLNFENNNCTELEEYLKENNCKNILLVCSKSFYKSNFYEVISNFSKKNLINVTYFDGFTPNPTYEEVCNGLKLFNENNCDSIIAIGGGSAIDVAKCIKLFFGMNDSEIFINQKIIPNDINLIAIPTTAGTGSESTHFAVIYYKGEKKSISDYSCIPNAVLFNQNCLNTLPLYQKKATILDAYSHAIESMWSINSTDESINYSKKAIKIIRENLINYLENNPETFKQMFIAANLAGKAINITKTTAGHALCYKLTSLYGIAHGHAAMLVNSELFPYMIENIDKCIDYRGKEYLTEILNEICDVFGYKSLEDSKNCFRDILDNLGLYNIDVNYNDLDTLVNSVNIERLSNHPIKLNNEDIREIYYRIFKKIEEKKNESCRFCKSIKF